MYSSGFKAVILTQCFVHEYNVAELAQIWRVQIVILSEAAKPDPTNFYKEISNEWLFEMNFKMCFL